MHGWNYQSHTRESNSIDDELKYIYEGDFDAEQTGY